jgi:hypothetical protein
MKKWIFAAFALTSICAQATVDCYSYGNDRELIQVSVSDTFIGTVARFNEEEFQVYELENVDSVAYYSQEKIMRLDIDLSKFDKSLPPQYDGKVFYLGLKKHVKCVFS